MKVILTMAMAAVLTIACNAQNETATMSVDLKSKKDSASYALGANIGKTLQMQGLELDPDILAMAMKHAMSGELAMTEDQIMFTLQAMQAEAMEKQQKQMSAKGDENLKKSEEWLAKNKSASGVMTTASGLQYKVLKEGTGAKVRVHYTGTLTDGTKFDSSVDRGEPAEFALNQVIPGWTEGLQLMSVGSKYMLYIHPDKGYGAQAPPSIGPNQALIFEVELLDIIK
jgi:FKBP-type peptidyl-prolyl cis-trans isomerase